MSASNWLSYSEDRRRERVTLWSALGLAFVVGVVVPLVHLAEPVVAKRALATLTHITLPPPPEVEVPPPPPPPPPKVEPVKATEVADVKPDIKPTPAPAVKQRVAVVDDEQPTITASEVASDVPAEPTADEQAIASLAAIDDAFADMREPDTSALKTTGGLQETAGEVAGVERSLIAANHGTRDLGVNLSSRSTGVGRVALAGRSSTHVSAPASASGSTHHGSGGDGSVRHLDRIARAQERSLEEIRRVFDANKGILFALYQSARAVQPSLAGKVVLELVIAPDGSVVNCRVISSEISDTALVDRVVERVRSFRFSADNVSTTTVTYPVHFLPT